MLTPNCTQEVIHTPGEPVLTKDPETGREFFRIFCIHCKKRLSDILKAEQLDLFNNYTPLIS